MIPQRGALPCACPRWRDNVTDDYPGFLRPPVRIPSAHRQERAGQLGNHSLRERTCRIDPFVHEHEIEDVPLRPPLGKRRSSTVGTTVQNADESGAIASRIPDSGVMCWHGR
jgi:hypothetical protein